MGVACIVAWWWHGRCGLRARKGAGQARFPAGAPKTGEGHLGKFFGGSRVHPSIGYPVHPGWCLVESPQGLALLSSGYPATPLRYPSLSFKNNIIAYNLGRLSTHNYDSAITPQNLQISPLISVISSTRSDPGRTTSGERGGVVFFLDWRWPYTTTSLLSCVLYCSFS